MATAARAASLLHVRVGPAVVLTQGGHISHARMKEGAAIVHKRQVVPRGRVDHLKATRSTPPHS